MGDEFRSPRWHWVWLRERSKRPRSTRSNESSSVRQSASFRRCDSSWRTWPRRWKRRGCWFIKDYPAEKYYRDVKLCTIGEGTSEIQKLVIARQLLGKK